MNANVKPFRKKPDGEPVRDRLLDIKEAARLLARSERAMYHLVERRQIPFLKHGRRLVFSEKALLELISELPSFTPIEDR